MADLETLAHHTLLLLEQRLARLEFLLTGHATAAANGAQESSTSNTKSIQNRLRTLDRALHTLTNSSPLLRLYTTIPGLSTPSPAAAAATDADPTAMSPAAVPTAAAAATALLLPALPTIHSTASQLRALADASPAPAPDGGGDDARALAHWAALAPRLERVARRQHDVGEQAAELRRRSARAVVRWHEGWVLGAGRCWVEWEGRLRAVEREAGRLEGRR